MIDDGVISRIKELMRIRGKTRADIARGSGLTPATVSRVLNGERRAVEAETLAGIARSLDTSVDFLTGATAEYDKSDSPPLPAYAAEVMETMRKLDKVRNLEVRDYVQVSGRLFIRSGKGDKDRIVFVGRQTRRVIWRYITERNIESINEPLLATNNLTPMRRDNVRRDLTNYAKEFGIKAYPHKFRHTFAVNFLRHGGNVRQLQAILGHEKLDMTMRYTKLAEIDLEAAKAFSPVDNAKKR